MIFYKKAKEKVKPSLKMHIHSTMPGMDPPRSHNPIHASDLTNADEFCPREYALLDATKLKRKPKFLGTSQLMTYDIGDAYHELLRTKWAVGVAVGTWECYKCGYIHEFTKRPIKCNHKCGCTEFRYLEESFHSQECGAVGNIDLIADLGEPKLRVVELKSMDKEEFKVLVGPKAEHALRSNLYLRMIQDSNHPHKHKINTQEAIILYMTKSFGFKDESIKAAGIKDQQFSSMKEYWVPRKDQDTDYLWDRARLLHQYRNHKGKMPEGICATQFMKRAQQCSMCCPCWSGKYPAGSK